MNLLKKIRHPIYVYKSVVMNSYLFFYLEFLYECCFESGKGGHFDGDSERENIDLNSWDAIRDVSIHCKTSG